MRGIEGIMSLITSLKEIKNDICANLDLLVYNVCLRFPMNKRLICFESEGDCCDNAFALYTYIRKTFGEKYKIIWFVDTPENYEDSQNERYVKKRWKNQNWKRNYYLATSGLYIYDHNNLLKDYKKRKNQKIIYLGHGFGFKAAKGGVTKKVKTSPDVVVAISELGIQSDIEWQKNCDFQSVILGYPRNDWLFENSDIVKNKMEKRYGFSAYKKIFLWMPTFRQSNAKGISEEYFENETGLPMFGTVEALENFNMFLAEKNIVFALKLHHLQAELPIFSRSFSNIIIIRDEDLRAMDIQLYQFISFTDVLITDYSSISADYILLDRPMIFTLDDVEEYRKSRGLREGVLDLMAGYHVYSIEQFKTAICEILQGLDVYKKERNTICKELHLYRDGLSAKRITEYLDL